MEPTGVLGALGAFNGYYFTGVLFLFSIVLVVVVSYLTSPEPEEKTRGLTYDSITPEQKAENRRSWGWPDVVGSLVVLGIVLGGYLYFSFWLS
jgi:SSS family solute:Na+ symporter